MSNQRSVVWDSLLDAEMNVRYWGYLAQRFASRERCLKIALAVSASGTLLALPLWKQFPAGPVALGIVNATLACSLPILNYSERIETMANLRGSWSQLSIEFGRV